MNDNNWYSIEKRKLLLKDRYFSGSHNYFFELKEASNGSKYIVIDQRKKIGDEFVGAKIRLFEDEMLEFQRVLNKMIDNALSANVNINDNTDTVEKVRRQTSDDNQEASKLIPTFFDILPITSDWKEFEKYTYYLLRLLGIPVIHSFLAQDQSGRADGFIKIGNLAIIYDCTLRSRQPEAHKNEQIINYCNRLQQGSICLSENKIEEFHGYNKHVWIITQKESRLIKTINSIDVKEIAIQDLMSLYEERLTGEMNIQTLEDKLRKI